MIFAENSRVEVKAVTSIEGAPTSGVFRVKSLIGGENISLLEVRVPKGVRSSLHAHSHESLIYVVSGRLRTTIGAQEYVMGPGDACCHSQHAIHSVEALEDTLFVEIKSPVPSLETTLGL